MKTLWLIHRIVWQCAALVLLATAFTGCEDSESASPSSASNDNTGSSGTGGSLARFAVVGEYFYAVTNRNLSAYRISPSGKLLPQAKQEVGFGVETMFPFEGKLLLGGQNGVFVYDLSDPAFPERTGRFRHITSCDPVVARGNFAFSTLRGGVPCRQGINQIDVLKLQENGDPELVYSYTAMEAPYGLGIKDTMLYVCDADRGVRIFNVAEVYDQDDEYRIKEIENITGFVARDIIIWEELMLVVGPESLRQYRLDNLIKPTPLSVISTATE